MPGPAGDLAAPRNMRHLLELGYRSLRIAPAEARQRAFVLYSYEVAESLLHRQGTLAQRQSRCRFVERSVQRRLGG